MSKVAIIFSSKIKAVCNFYGSQYVEIVLFHYENPEIISDDLELTTILISKNKHKQQTDRETDKHT